MRGLRVLNIPFEMTTGAFCKAEVVPRWWLKQPRLMQNSNPEKGQSKQSKATQKVKPAGKSRGLTSFHPKIIKMNFFFEDTLRAETNTTRT